MGIPLTRVSTHGTPVPLVRRHRKRVLKYGDDDGGGGGASQHTPLRVVTFPHFLGFPFAHIVFA